MTRERFAEIEEMRTSIRKALLRLNPDLSEGPGIYIWTRTDEDSIRYAYIGQAKHILARQVQHVFGKGQALDLGLKQHGLYDAQKNPHGYRIGVIPCVQADLDEAERHYILLYAKRNYQILNRTTGGNKGKRLIGDKYPFGSYAEGRKSMAQEIREVAETLHITGDEILKQRFWEILSEGEGYHD